MRFRKCREPTSRKSSRAPVVCPGTYFRNTCRPRRVGNDKSSFVVDFDALAGTCPLPARHGRRLCAGSGSGSLAVNVQARAIVSATKPRRFRRGAVLNLLLIPVVNNIQLVVTTRGAIVRVHTVLQLVPGTACSNNGVEFSALAQPAARISEKSR